MIPTPTCRPLQSCDKAMEASVLCFGDNAHATAAETFHDAVVPEGLANQRVGTGQVEHILGWGRWDVNKGNYWCDASGRYPFRGSTAESLGGPSFCLGGLFFSILRWRVCFERTEQTSRDVGDFIDGSLERVFVGLRRFVKAADFSDELERSSADLVGSDGWIEVEEGLDIPAHRTSRYKNAQAARTTSVCACSVTREP